MPVLSDGDAGALAVQYETFQTFTSRLDAVVARLESSHAAPRTVGRDRVARGHLGHGFQEADALTAAYGQVHDRLTAFSAILADQLRAMRIAVREARDGYRHTDAEQREKLWAIHRRTLDRQAGTGATGSALAPAPAADPSVPPNASTSARVHNGVGAYDS